MTQWHMQLFALCTGVVQGVRYIGTSSGDRYHVTLFFHFSLLLPFHYYLARSPSTVRNLTAIVNFDQSKNKITANVSWIGPETPYGNISHYVVVLSSPKAATITKRRLDVMVCIRHSTHCYSQLPLPYWEHARLCVHRSLLLLRI